MSGRESENTQSVAKRSPQSHPVHLTPHLSTIEEGDVDMTEEAADSAVSTEAAVAAVAGANSGGESNVAALHSNKTEPSAEDVQHAEAFQVS